MILTASWHMLTMTKTHTKKNIKTKKKENFQEEKVHVPYTYLRINQSFAQFTMSSLLLLNNILVLEEQIFIVKFFLCLVFVNFDKKILPQPGAIWEGRRVRPKKFVTIGN